MTIISLCHLWRVRFVESPPQFQYSANSAIMRWISSRCTQPASCCLLADVLTQCYSNRLCLLYHTFHKIDWCVSFSCLDAHISVVRLLVDRVHDRRRCFGVRQFECHEKLVNRERIDRIKSVCELFYLFGATQPTAATVYLTIILEKRRRWSTLKCGKSKLLYNQLTW